MVSFSCTSCVSDVSCVCCVSCISCVSCVSCISCVSCVSCVSLTSWSTSFSMSSIVFCHSSFDVVIVSCTSSCCSIDFSLSSACFESVSVICCRFSSTSGTSGLIGDAFEIDSTGALIKQELNISVLFIIIICFTSVYI